MRMRWRRGALGFVVLALLWSTGCEVMELLPSPISGGEVEPYEDRALSPAYDVALLLNLVWHELNNTPRHFQPGMLFPGALPNQEAVVPDEEHADAWWEAYCSQRLLTSTVGVYTGSGADRLFWTAITNFLDHYGIAWEKFDETDLHALGERFDAVWFPGGYSAQYRTKIGEHHLIREFVENGGAFIGICAGAYYATSTMRWHGGVTDYPLNLFDGDGIGPMSEVGWGNTTTLKIPDHPMAHRMHTEVLLEVYYMDGPYFHSDDAKGVETLAHYAVNGEAAIITFPYGRGRVLLIGPHPEMGYDQQSRQFTTDGSHGAQWPWLKEMVRMVLCR